MKTVKDSAIKIEAQFRAKFGYDTHIRLKSKESQGWSKEVVSSGLRGMVKSGEKKPLKEVEVLDEEDEFEKVA